jgi:hypothetical protein
MKKEETEEDSAVLAEPKGRSGGIITVASRRTRDGSEESADQKRRSDSMYPKSSTLPSNISSILHMNGNNCLVSCAFSLHGIVFDCSTIIIQSSDPITLSRHSSGLKFFLFSCIPPDVFRKHADDDPWYIALGAISRHLVYKFRWYAK